MSLDQDTPGDHGGSCMHRFWEMKLVLDQVTSLPVITGSLRHDRRPVPAPGAGLRRSIQAASAHVPSRWTHLLARAAACDPTGASEHAQELNGQLSHYR